MSKMWFQGVAVVAMGFVASVAMAVPRSGEIASPEYLFEPTNLQGFHLGFDGRTRFVNYPTWNDNLAVIGQYHAVLAYDLIPGLAVYGLMGVGRMDADEPIGRNNKTNTQAAPSYGAGLWANFFDRMLMTNFETLDRVRFQGTVQYSRFGTEMSDWNEVLGNVTVGIVNSVSGNKAFWPVEVTLYAGPSFSVVWADEALEVNQSSDVFGGIVGIDILFDKVLSFGASIELYSNGPAYSGSAMIRF